MTFSQWQKQEFNYNCITTFWQDFSIADHFGKCAVKDTYKRAMRDFKTDYKYLAELVIVLNHKCWQHYNKGLFELSSLYSDLYYKARNYALDNLKGEEYEYFYQITD